MPINTPLAFAYSQDTVSDTALSLADLSGLSAADVASADRVVLTVSQNAVRVRWDGTAPTTSSGHVLSVDESYSILTRQPFVLSGNNLSNLQIIRDGSFDAVIEVTLEAY